jgi:hypothetical protein
MTAGTAEDINVNGLDFVISAVSGAFTVANMYDMYATYQIGNGAVVTTSTVSSPTATQPFSVSFTLPKGQTVKIELFSKLAGTVTEDNSVRATLTVSGTGAQSGAIVNSAGVPGQTIIAKAGSLSVTFDASTPITALVTGGSNSVKAAAYKFEAQNDAYSISQLNFILTGTSAITNFYLKDGSTVIASASPAKNITINLPTPITIPANTSKVINVELDLGSIGTGAGLMGSNVSVDLDTIIVRPASSGEASTETISLDPSNKQYVYKSIPTINLVSLSDTRLTVGTKTLQKFTISADSKGPIAWNQIKFNLSRSAATTVTGLGVIVPSGASSTAVALYDGTTLIPGKITNTTNFSIAGNASNPATLSTVLTFVPDVEQQIAAGTSKTYELKVVVAGSTAAGTYLMSNIASDTLQGTGTGVLSSTLIGSNFVWSDMSAQGHSTATADWTNGHLVKNLPTDTQSLIGSN